MKFLVIATRREQLPVPPEALPAMLSADHEWIVERLDDGTFDAVYGFPQGGGVAIANARDGEELSGILMSAPVFLINNWDVRPLLEMETMLENITGAVNRVLVGAPS
jgi:hypothetical protein